VVDGPVGDCGEADGRLLVVDGEPNDDPLEASGRTAHHDALQVGELLDVHILVLVEDVEEVAEVHLAAHALYFLHVFARQTFPVEVHTCVLNVDLGGFVHCELQGRDGRGGRNHRSRCGKRT